MQLRRRGLHTESVSSVQRYVDGVASLFTLLRDGSTLGCWGVAPGVREMAGGSLESGVETATDTVLDRLAEGAVEGVADPVLMPWWLAVIAGTFVFRACFTLPIAVTQRRRVLRLAALQPVLKAWENTLKRAPATASPDAAPSSALHSAAITPNARRGDRAQAAFKAKADALYAMHNCSPRSTFILPWVQIPLFVTLSLAVRRLAGLPLPFTSSLAPGNPTTTIDLKAPTSDISSTSDHNMNSYSHLPQSMESSLMESEASVSSLSPVNFEATATLPVIDTTTAAIPVDWVVPSHTYMLSPVEGFETEGFMWFLDLSVADPTVLLPLIVGSLHLANIEMHSSTVAAPSVRQRAFKLLFQSIAVLMIPLATQVPAGVALYWAASAGFSLAQNALLQLLVKKG
ncbi:60Kd inner membrane protein-domain-containing protein [Chytriomyces sp. MP71]|nr:60Kd inner membrane protein-domain-containing protein [Chytriomyces sp. MP71]